MLYILINIKCIYGSKRGDPRSSCLNSQVDLKKKLEITGATVRPIGTPFIISGSATGDMHYSLLHILKYFIAAKTWNKITDSCSIIQPILPFPESTLLSYERRLLYMVELVFYSKSRTKLNKPSKIYLSKIFQFFFYRMNQSSRA